MHREVSQLILYSDLPQDSILTRLSGIFRDWNGQAAPEAKPELIRRIYVEVKRLLDLATVCGFDRNLWHNYLTYLLISHENSFSLTCEMTGAGDGSINHIAKADLSVFLRLFAYDFGPIERDLSIDCFTTLTHYRAIPKREQVYNRAVSESVQGLSAALEQAKDAEEAFALVTEHYRRFGVGLFGLNRAFRVRQVNGAVDFVPITNVDNVRLDDLVGYDIQKAQLRENIEAFLDGTGFNNMLLYGDAGTGKSTSVKAALNEYHERGLRVIEVYKHQFGLLSEIISGIKNRHCHFIIFLDDLSFEEQEVEYKYLKAVIEGGIETRPDNVMICATSNRRHLVKETWKDRDDMEHDGDVHRSDTMEEKLSLASRFGCAISYQAPDPKLYREIVKQLAARRSDIRLSEEELLREANRWEIRHGGYSGRTAQQFINAVRSKSST